MTTAELWQKIQSIYHAALERRPEERSAFLDQACGGDVSLRREIDSLLSSHDEAGSFLNTPATQLAAIDLAAEQAYPKTGSRIGPYKLVSLLGRGGMGEVYLAEDTRLGRKVALKLLDTSLITNLQLRARFLREAQLASSLDHPNICTIHEIGEHAGQMFIAMQYVEGKTLKQAIDSRPLGFDGLVSVSLQIADALALAHERGIVHRDIKPTNIIVTPRGQVKVLDFGLAKLIESHEESEDTLTRTGAVMGTPAFMSPEQARGKGADHRSDIFSFGVVLYEMATGALPFKGQSQAETMNAVINLPHVPASELNRDVPLDVATIIDRALAKRPDDRYKTMRDLIADLRRAAGLSSGLRNRSDVPDGVIVPYVPTSRETVFNRLERTLHLSPSRKWRAALAILLVLVIAVAAVWLIQRNADLKRASRQLPQLEELAKAGRFFEAYDLATSLEQHLPDDPTIARLMASISVPLTAATDPPGARVYLRRFAPNGMFPERNLVGTTPITDKKVARGDYVIYVEKEGYATVERTVSGGGFIRETGYMPPPSPIKIDERLIESSRVPDRMVYVAGGDYRLSAWRRPTDERVRLGGFFIDRYEVTNQEFKEFINGGGYLRRELWKHTFIKAGRELKWEEAMRELRDRTGLPGPRSWSGQNYPEGRAAHPVTEITWYEAAAYAEFRGKRLPTMFEWEKAARNGQSSFAGLTLPWGLSGETTDHRANFKSAGTSPVDSFEFGMSPFGCYNMAGNVGEWCLNETTEGFITAGGSWEDPAYLFGYYGTYPPFHSSNKLGFRCAATAADGAGDQGAMKINIANEVPVYTPASESTVRGWFKYYDYEKSPLDAEVIETIETQDWRREKVAYGGADGERVVAYLYLPKNHKGPFQVVHFIPAADVARRIRPLPDSIQSFCPSIIKSGRAIFGVVLKGYIERDLPAGYVDPSPDRVEYVEQSARHIIDMRRGLDYLVTRGDVDAQRIALFAPSVSGYPFILPAVEGRYRSVVFCGSSIRKYHLQWKPEVSPINFAPQIRQPKLMMHGRYDEAAPLKTEGEPLFKLYREPKRLFLYEGGHVPSQEVFVPALSAWLDETMGPVGR
jgi:serine/threonine protein kinase/formylglycine-generating enzyme required for sulfatase activity